MMSDQQGSVLTFSSLATSGLNAGILMYWRNRVEILFLSPSSLAALTPRVIRSTSLSIKSTMSRVSGHACSCPVKTETVMLHNNNR